MNLKNLQFKKCICCISFIYFQLIFNVNTEIKNHKNAKNLNSFYEKFKKDHKLKNLLEPDIIESLDPKLNYEIKLIMPENKYSDMRKIFSIPHARKERREIFLISRPPMNYGIKLILIKTNGKKNLIMYQTKANTANDIIKK